MAKTLVFTDLDGTLLDHDTYSWQEARPALDLLRRLDAPCIFVTSKTRAETERWRAELDNRHPFIVENGGAAFIPAGYWPAPVPGARRAGAYEALEWGAPYSELIRALDRAAEASQCRVRGFHRMPDEKVAELCGLPLAEARLARQREYDEPFVVLDGDRAAALTGAIEALGLGWTRGGRFWHILGGNDKAAAVRALIGLYRAAAGPVRSIGLGDGLNDAGFLNEVDQAVLIRSPRLAELQALVPRGRVTAQPGPSGWKEAVLRLLSRES